MNISIRRRLQSRDMSPPTTCQCGSTKTINTTNTMFLLGSLWRDQLQFHFSMLCSFIYISSVSRAIWKCFTVWTHASRRLLTPDTQYIYMLSLVGFRVSARRNCHWTTWPTGFQFTGRMFEITVRYLSELSLVALFSPRRLSCAVLMGFCREKPLAGTLETGITQAMLASLAHSV